MDTAVATNVGVAGVAAPKKATKSKARASGKAKGKAENLPGSGKAARSVLHFRTFDIKGGRGECTPPREGSKRGTLYKKLVEDGRAMTMEQIMELGKLNGGEGPWKHRDAMDALRLLGKVNHVSVKYDADTKRWSAVKK